MRILSEHRATLGTSSFQRADRLTGIVTCSGVDIFFTRLHPLSKNMLIGGTVTVYLPLDVNACAHSALQWADLPSIVCSYLASRDSVSTRGVMQYHLNLK